jgi:hypothetical protein
MMFSQSGDKKVNYLTVPPITPTKFYSRLHGWVVFAVFTLTLIGWFSFVYFVLAPSGARKDMLRKAEQQASLDAPKVLAKLLGEMELLRSEMNSLRLAVEKVAEL